MHKKVEPLPDEVFIAALADIHCAEDAENLYKPVFQKIGAIADILLLAGDLTRYGRIQEAKTLAGELSVLSIPVFAVLGNHDHHLNLQDEIISFMNKHRVVVLDGNSSEVRIRNISVGIAGTKGFGGGFGIRALPEFGEDILKNFYRVTIGETEKLGRAIRQLKADIKIVLLHYSPISETLLGEPHEIYAFMGSSVLSEAIDKYDIDLVIHGHAHFGSEDGQTRKGVPVKNVSLPMLGKEFAVYGVRPGKRIREIIM